MSMAMTQPVKMIFGCIAACNLAFLFAVADGERTNPCSETQYWVEYADGSYKCEDCPSCPPGQGLSEECGKRIKPNAFVICQPCQPKLSFSSKDDTLMCALCSLCAQYQVVLRNCTPESDIKCAKRCSSMDRYYNDAKGECLPCSKCCGDDHDLVEVECQEKMGPGSNKICSFDTSVNRCGKATNWRSQHEHTTIAMKITATADNYTSPSQGSKSEQTDSNNLSQRKDQDFWTAAIIPTVILALMAICGCVYIYKTGHPNGWCRGDPEIGSGALDADGADDALSKNDGCYRLEVIQPESSEPLLKEVLIESDSEMLSCICEMDTKRDSKPLNSLLERESDLQRICNCLDAHMAGVGNYRAVAQYYGYDHYEIVSVLEKLPGGASRALIESLKAKKPELTVADFASVVRKEAKRNDVVKLLEEYDLK